MYFKAPQTGQRKQALDSDKISCEMTPDPPKSKSHDYFTYSDSIRTGRGSVISGRIEISRGEASNFIVFKGKQSQITIRPQLLKVHLDGQTQMTRLVLIMDPTFGGGSLQGGFQSFQGVATSRVPRTLRFLYITRCVHVHFILCSFNGFLVVYLARACWPRHKLLVSLQVVWGLA